MHSRDLSARFFRHRRRCRFDISCLVNNRRGRPCLFTARFISMAREFAHSQVKCTSVRCGMNCTARWGRARVRARRVHTRGTGWGLSPITEAKRERERVLYSSGVRVKPKLCAFDTRRLRFSIFSSLSRLSLFSFPPMYKHTNARNYTGVAVIQKRSLIYRRKMSHNHEVEYYHAMMWFLFLSFFLPLAFSTYRYYFPRTSICNFCTRDFRDFWWGARDLIESKIFTRI